VSAEKTCGQVQGWQKNSNEGGELMPKYTGPKKPQKPMGKKKGGKKK